MLKKVGFCVDRKGFGVYLEVNCKSQKIPSAGGDFEVCAEKD